MQIIHLIILLLLSLSASSFALDALPPVNPVNPVNIESQPQKECVASATASCGTGQVASARPAKQIGVTLPSWCPNPDKTAVEQIICAVPDIAKLDNDLNRLYQMSPNPDMVASRRAERDACQTAECVRQWYQKWLPQKAMGDQQLQPQSYQPLPTVTQYAPPAPVMIQPSSATNGATAFTYWQSSELTDAEQRLQQMQMQLAALDNRLNERWKSRSRSRKETTAQKAWLQQRDAAIGSGANADQIAEMYRRRIAQL